jgi:hypothetical protein
MKNDLDPNLSNGSFQFNPSDHDTFVAHLTKTPEGDRDGYAAYSYRESDGDGNVWTFLISADKSRCRYSLGR